MVYAVPWYLSLLISFPQAIIMLLLGFTLFNLKIPFQKIMLVAALLSVFSYFIRHLPIALITNSLAMVTALAILSSIIFQIKLKYAIPPVLCGFTTYLVIEFCVVYAEFSLTDYDMNSIMQNPWVDFLMFIPALILSIVGYGIIKINNFVLIDFNSRLLEFN